MQSASHVDSSIL